MTGRKLVLLTNIHTFEPLDPTTVKEVVTWLSNSFNLDQTNQFTYREQSYYIIDILLIVSLASFIGLFAPLSELFGRLLPGGPRTPAKARNRFLRERTILFGWGFLGVILFIPSMLVGFVVNYPPLIFGSS